MIKIKELKKETNSFSKEFIPLVKELAILIKEGEGTHKELNKKVNELISCLNVLNHQIKENAQYSDDSDDWI